MSRTEGAPFRFAQSTDTHAQAASVPEDAEAELESDPRRRSRRLLHVLQQSFHLGNLAFLRRDNFAAEVCNARGGKGGLVAHLNRG